MAGRLLALWGHRVALLDRAVEQSRGLAESIPPSTRKLLEQVGVLDAVERAGFFRTRGNTVWWASRERRVERFGEHEPSGFAVFRPEFDRVLRASAGEAGVEMRRATVRHISLDDAECARVDFEEGGEPASVAARFVLDCSGRAGILARRFRIAQPGHRTCALVGVWQRRDGSDAWGLPDETHTVVETFEDGWSWSVPTSAGTRHVGAMVGQAFSSDSEERTLASAYRRALAETQEVARLVGGAELRSLWACDASLYSSSAYAGSQFLLVGDAGSFIDPLSSFGVKKAIASAWVAAITAHTALAHPERAAVASDFFEDWERRVYSSHIRQTRAFARAAMAMHPHPFWAQRVADAPDEPETADDDPASDPLVRRAFEAVKAAPSLNLALSATAALELRPLIRGHEIVLEPALAGGMRFVANVDLLKLAQMAPNHTQVPDLFDAYCRTCPPVPLPNVMGGLSLLVAKGILHERP